MTPVRLKLAAPRSRVKHSTTEPLRSDIHSGVTGYTFQKKIILLSLNIDFVLANNADPDEMPPYDVVCGCVIPGHAHFHFSLNVLRALWLSVTISTEVWCWDQSRPLDLQSASLPTALQGPAIVLSEDKLKVTSWHVLICRQCPLL